MRPKCAAAMSAGIAAILLTLTALPGAARAGSVVKTIQQRGVVRCSVPTANGFASHDEQGRPVGLAVDLCRALAAAVLGNAEAIELRHFPRSKDMAAIESHEVDASFSLNSWTPARDAGRKVEFGPAFYYDTQGLAVWTQPATAMARDRRDGVVCVTAGTSVRRNLDSLIRANGQKWTLRTGNSWEETLQAFLARECAMLAADRGLLDSALHDLTQTESGISILPDVMARDALAPMIATDDHQWQLIVRWTVFALFLAEEKGISRANAADKRQSGDLETRRLLTGVPTADSRLGLTDDWAFQVISRVGNYGEIFNRNLGSASPYRQERGLNKPWIQGGLLYAPPFQ